MFLLACTMMKGRLPELEGVMLDAPNVDELLAHADLARPE